MLRLLNAQRFIPVTPAKPSLTKLLASKISQNHSVRKTNNSEYNTMAATRTEPAFEDVRKERRSIVVSPRADDVLIGRGTQVNRHLGNIRLRKLLRQHSGHYVSLPTSEAKHSFAVKVIEEVTMNGGRFLQRANVNGGVVWEVQRPSTTLSLVKQGFEDYAEDSTPVQQSSPKPTRGQEPVSPDLLAAVRQAELINQRLKAVERAGGSAALAQRHSPLQTSLTPPSQGIEQLRSLSPARMVRTSSAEQVRKMELENLKTQIMEQIQRQQLLLKIIGQETGSSGTMDSSLLSPSIDPSHLGPRPKRSVSPYEMQRQREQQQEAVLLQRELLRSQIRRKEAMEAEDIRQRIQRQREVEEELLATSETSRRRTSPVGPSIEPPISASEINARAAKRAMAALQRDMATGTVNLPVKKRKSVK